VHRAISLGAGIRNPGAIEETQKIKFIAMRYPVLTFDQKMKLKAARKEAARRRARKWQSENRDLVRLTAARCYRKKASK